MFIFVMKNYFAFMDDLNAKIDDLNDDEAKTNFGKIQSSAVGSF